MITLYKDGNTHEVRGVACELKTFKNDELYFALSQGYFVDPKDIAEAKKKEARAKKRTESLKAK